MNGKRPRENREIAMTANVIAIRTRQVTRAIVSLSSVLTSVAFAQTADLAVTNARIYTVNPKQPRASAMAVRGARILAVSDDVSHYISGSTTIIDAKGATVIPGLIDSHGHVRGLGDMLENIDLR